MDKEELEHYEALAKEIIAATDEDRQFVIGKDLAKHLAEGIMRLIHSDGTRTESGTFVNKVGWLK